MNRTGAPSNPSAANGLPAIAWCISPISHPGPPAAVAASFPAASISSPRTTGNLLPRRDDLQLLSHRGECRPHVAGVEPHLRVGEPQRLQSGRGVGLVTE